MEYIFCWNLQKYAVEGRIINSVNDIDFHYQWDYNVNEEYRGCEYAINYVALRQERNCRLL